MHGSDIAQRSRPPGFPERDGFSSSRRDADRLPPTSAPISLGYPCLVAFTTPTPGLTWSGPGNTGEFRPRVPMTDQARCCGHPPPTLAQLFYQRIGPLGAARRGLRIVGGRRPWVALKLMHYFAPA